MEASTVAVVAVLLAIVALLYSTVGHAGGSGYLAVMALIGIAPATMRPAALVLNILVAVIASTKFYRAGHFSWSLFWPFAILSIPAAFAGGVMGLPSHVYKIVAGVILLYSAVHAFMSQRVLAEKAQAQPPLPAALAIGASIGIVSGLIGVGGGIFLSPLLLFMGWAGARQAAAASAMFILVNSVSGLLGQITSVRTLPPYLLAWAVAVVAGGWVGATYGSERLPTTALRRALAAVLVIAGLKLIFT
ncbi:MAG TPA: sulfite exporter TauE/SafE family protein [Gemmatimonadaceae bacterium]|nr:sulfite exporter TauE/SafE family protein [Gemmatimonadaceae bacterium]